MSRRRGPAWTDERKLARGDVRIEQSFSELRSEATFQAAKKCEQCEQTRLELDDDDALCETHLAQALGMNSDWQ
ncbi:MAG TPA: hypothetical protein DCQ06_13425 [Myxococcales bacterium]|nr:hypothetical protein [Myxococcales bacterium]HAN32591.1 hypothetical protein [Myxococcales bacterium]